MSLVNFERVVDRLAPALLLFLGLIAALVEADGGPPSRGPFSWSAPVLHPWSSWRRTCWRMREAGRFSQKGKFPCRLSQVAALPPTLHGLASFIRFPPAGLDECCAGGIGMPATMERLAKAAEAPRTGSPGLASSRSFAMSGPLARSVGQSVALRRSLTTERRFCVTSNVGRALSARGDDMVPEAATQAVCAANGLAGRTIGGTVRA